MSLLNAWTGGQYSLYRAVLGSYLFMHFASLVPWGAELFSSSGMLPDATASPLYPLFPDLLFVLDAPGVVVALLLVGVGASVLLAAGIRDRTAALLLWYVWACLFARNPLIANPSLPFVGWLLLAHALVPPAPYGSWAARTRTDPDGGWHMPTALFAAAWIVMALGYSYSGYTKLVSPSWLDGSALGRVLENPLARPSFAREMMLLLPGPLLALLTWGTLAFELLYAPLALLRALRPWIWTGMLLLHLSLMTLIDFVDLSFGMVLVHAFTFDPAWVRAQRSDAGPVHVFYDGGCGLCHRAVRFLLAEDREGVFRFAPLESERFGEAVGPDLRDDLPDSIVLLLPDGRLQVRSGALIEIGRRLGGAWGALARAARVVPAFLRDAAYDGVARIRHRLFARPEAACPLLPAHLRERFDS